MPSKAPPVPVRVFPTRRSNSIHLAANTGRVIVSHSSQAKSPKCDGDGRVHHSTRRRGPPRVGAIVAARAKAFALQQADWQGVGRARGDPGDSGRRVYRRLTAQTGACAEIASRAVNDPQRNLDARRQ